MKDFARFGIKKQLFYSEKLKNSSAFKFWLKPSAQITSYVLLSGFLKRKSYIRGGESK